MSNYKTPLIKENKIDPIVWVCSDCGIKHGTRNPIGATMHYDTCDICKKENVAVTSPRKFGIRT